MGSRLRYRIAGDSGPLLTLIHGGWLDSRAWDQHVDALASELTVLAPDVRGYGGSEPAGATWSVADWALDVIALWDELGLDRGHVLGFSMGGLIALDLAVTAAERLDGLVLVSTTARFDDAVRAGYRATANGFGAEQYDAALARHLEVAFAPGFRAERPDFLAAYERAARETPLATVRTTMLALAEADYADALGGIDVPTLVVHGTEDRVTGGHHPAALLAGLAHARERVVEGAGHTLHLERPQEFAGLVKDFVREGGA